jgi:hypothetical protein
MISRYLVIVAALCLCGTSADALTMKECSVKYKAAQTAGTLNGQKWKDFRKAECGSEASASPATAPAVAPAPKAAAAPAASSGTPPARPATAKPSAATASSAAPVPPIGNAIFPNAVSPKYSSESAGKARMHTCLEQYNANKANNGNGGLKWTEKGGGYYSECNKRLKS